MRAFVSVLVLAAPLTAPLAALGAPVKRLAANSTDVLVLQFADVLEHFENEFYMQALGKFQQADFVAAGFSNAQIPVQQFKAIQSDEAAHVTALESALQAVGASPISGCQFNFSNALSSVATMAATARIVENLGVSAYLGAANMISDPILLTAAASIMTIEARHQTVLNLLNGATALPQSFDIPFTPSEVLAIAGQFISGCDLGIPANQPLEVTNAGPPLPGTTLSLSSPAINGSTDTLFCQMLVGGLPFSIPMNFNSCVVPDTVNGPVAVFITSDGQPLNNNVKDQNTNTIVAGPTIVFVNANVDVLGELALGGAASANVTNVGISSMGSSTQTISPSQASVILSSALAQGASVAATASAAPSSVNTAAAATTPSASSMDTAAAASATPSVSGVDVSASVSGSAAPAVATGSSNTSSSNGFEVVEFPGGPNLYVGPAADGSVTINGWS